MNKTKLLLQLKEIIENSSRYKLYFDLGFIDDIKNLLSREASGNEATVLNLLQKQIQYVIDFGKSVNEPDSNEILKHVSGETIYSLHIQNKIVNIRLLVMFYGDEALFLSAFSEKSGKKVTEYPRNISIALDRYSRYKNKEG